jgi:sugar phosphate isomerase/epimerase
MPAAARLGTNAPRQRPLEDTLEWAAANGFTSVDFNADAAPNGPGDFPADRVRRVRDLCARHGLGIGIHTSSAVNNAEVAPYVGEAVDAYLRANVELAERLGGGWVIVHGGYHFTSDVDRRREAAVARLRRLLEVAERHRVPLWLENHNKEPDRAEIHYLPMNVEELRWFLEAPGLSDSPWLRWSFNAAHAHLVPEGVPGFLEAFGVDRIAQVRLADNTGEYEVHLVPGQGTIDFQDLFRRLDRAGYTGPYSLDFGTDEDKIRVRDEWLAL